MGSKRRSSQQRKYPVLSVLIAPMRVCGFRDVVFSYNSIFFSFIFHSYVDKILSRLSLNVRRISLNPTRSMIHFTNKKKNSCLCKHLNKFAARSLQCIRMCSSYKLSCHCGSNSLLPSYENYFHVKKILR
ncbi:hypothetical protein CLIB1423_07S00914 [[Candida] railenensis]|uniref:Uncharacterized protein n=1 Tax=[Candida] railenensis TaxID=45579 RepID=A0A9P0QPG1_9ASCO|nr:hypothetical protein CLIB1423_07S00914 [[Candida] railenensis]